MTVAVVVGSGSAGMRHARTLAGRPDVERVVVVRRPGSSSPGPTGAGLAVDTVGSLEDALAHRPSIGVVASPAPMHTGAALALVDRGCHVLVEKPLAASADDPLLRELGASGNEPRVLVGYHLRFSDTARTIRHLVADGAIGRVDRAELRVGQHLDQWRPGTDPSTSVSARADLGGGVLLELSHEIDMVRFLLDTDVDAVVRSDLRYDGAPTDGSVETEADLLLRTGTGAAAEVHLDMVAPVPFRRWRLHGSDGSIDADVLRGEVVVSTGRSRRTVTAPSGERDRCEERLVDHLVDLRRSGTRPACTVADGLAALQVVDRARALAGRRPVEAGR